MTPRTVSVRVAHEKGCAQRRPYFDAAKGRDVVADPTSMDSLKGCTCQPSYYTFARDRRGVPQKGARYKDKRFVQRLAVELQNELNKGRGGWTEELNIDFPEWVDRYLADLEKDVARGRRSGATLDTYRRTLKDVAVPVIGWVPVRSISETEIRKFDDKLGAVTDATRRKHLAHLSACLGKAVRARYAVSNVVRPYLADADIRYEQGTPPFDAGELARLLAQLSTEASVYAAIAEAASLTGARVGELVALDWSDVDLQAGTVEIRHTYSPDYGLTRPKDKDARTLHLTGAAQSFFERWVREQGVQADGRVFPAPRGGGYVNDDYLRKVIVKAMADAGIAKMHPKTKRPRKPLHSLRASFATQMIVDGRNPHWVEQQLGHSSLALTMSVYTSWSDEQLRAEARRTTVKA